MGSLWTLWGEKWSGAVKLPAGWTICRNILHTDVENQMEKDDIITGDGWWAGWGSARHGNDAGKSASLRHPLRGDTPLGRACAIYLERFGSSNIFVQIFIEKINNNSSEEKAEMLNVDVLLPSFPVIFFKNGTITLQREIIHARTCWQKKSICRIYKNWTGKNS